MKNKKKNMWKKPELIIISRCFVEENVLAFCNETGGAGCDDPSSLELNPS